MSWAATCSCLAFVGLVATSSARADPADERETWRAQVIAAKARALEARQRSLADLARAKLEPRLPPESADLELARRNSEAVLSDSSLRPGDLVSTINGLFVFRGRSDREPHADDFVPAGAPPAQR